MASDPTSMTTGCGKAFFPNQQRLQVACYSTCVYAFSDELLNVCLLLFSFLKVPSRSCMGFPDTHAEESHTSKRFATVLLHPFVYVTNMEGLAVELCCIPPHSSTCIGEVAES